MQDTLESFGIATAMPNESTYLNNTLNRQKYKHVKNMSHKKCNKNTDKSKGFQHKKSLGQHFLHDSIILDKILQSIPQKIATQIDNGVRLIEVGIGLGDLTKRLLSKYKLLAYEVDSSLIMQAQKNYAKDIEEQRLQLIQADALQVKHNNGYLLNDDYFLVSNLPYYIATAIILRALKDEHCLGFLVMTQKEVAQKFCAEVKDSKYCALSVLANSFGTMQYLFEVSKESFNPMPKVQSAVFCFQRDKCLYTQDLESLLHAAFLAPRKKLFSNLMQWDKVNNKATLTHIFEYMGLNHEARAHEISLQEYCNMLHIYNVINKDKQ